MTATEVHTSVDQTVVLTGTLFAHRRRSHESATFAYSPAYLARPGAYQLDPQLSMGVAPHQTAIGSKIFGAFSDCAPDRWGRTLLERRESAIARDEGRIPRALSEVDFLLGVRDDLRQGALRFRQGGGEFLAPVDDGVPALTDLPELLSLAAAAERDDVSLPDLKRLVRVGSSLGGARPKAHVRNVDGRIAIAKFPSARTDTWNVMAWEKVMLDLAEAAGIEVPRSDLYDLAGRHVLVVDRFDRGPDGERRGYISAMTMLEARDGDQRSYLEIAEVIETRSLHAGEDLEQLWRRIVFNVLVSNTDDHLRNHGFLHTGGDSWQLAPAFDLNPDPELGPKFLSTAIDARDDTASIGLALSVAGWFRLSPERAVTVLNEVAGSVDTWKQVAGQWLSRADVIAMEPAFSAERF